MTETENSSRIDADLESVRERYVEEGAEAAGAETAEQLRVRRGGQSPRPSPVLAF